MKEFKNIFAKLFALSLAVLIALIVASMPPVSSTAENVKSTSADFAPAGETHETLSGESAIRYLKENNEFDSLGAAVTAARYEAEQSDAGASAANYANQIRTAFSPAGLVIESAEPGEKWQSRWRLQSLERGRNRRELGNGEVQTDGSRITIRHHAVDDDRSQIPDPKSQIVEEWFNNTPEGLEHGFTLAERLSDGGENLRLSIAVEGDLKAEADAEAQSLILLNEQGEAVLNYDKLRVWDADGAEVAARMMTERGTVTLEVEDAAATYPLVIDPTFTASAKLIANGGAAGDWFGKSVAISGDTVVVGVPHDLIGANAAQGS